MTLGLRECAEYFSKNKGYKRLFEGLREKYRSLGYLGGNIIIENPHECERDAIRGLLSKDYSNQRKISIKISDIEKALKDTKFEDYSLYSIMEAYFGKAVLSKRQEKTDYDSLRKEYFNDILSHMGDGIGRAWLNYILETKFKPYNLIIQKYNKEPQILREMLILVSTAMEAIYEDVGRIKRLAVFATNISGNPHCFDEGSELDKLFTHSLCYLLDVNEPNNAEEKSEILYKLGIIKDDISNYTVCYGLEAYRYDGIKHTGWSEFARLKESLHVSLANLAEIDKVIPYNKNVKKIYAVENPSVFSSILDSIIYDNIALICTNGQPRLASLILMDKLVEEGVSIYYSGDFDPEGLLIADKLKSRYGDKLILWKYSIKEYELSMSDKIIDSKRLSKLKKIKDSELKEVALRIEEIAMAGYQEKIIDKYLEDFINLDESDITELRDMFKVGY